LFEIQAPYVVLCGYYHQTRVFHTACYGAIFITGECLKVTIAALPLEKPACPALSAAARRDPYHVAFLVESVWHAVNCPDKAQPGTPVNIAVSR
jgi:hypothetical protein